MRVRFKLNRFEDLYYCVLPLRPTKKKNDFIRLWMNKRTLLELDLEEEIQFPLKGATIRDWIDDRNYAIEPHPTNTIFYIDAPSVWVPSFRNLNIDIIFSFDNGKLVEVKGDKLKVYREKRYILLHEDGREEETDDSWIYS
jgi:hypothetical protein